jgi:hypothetical protein
MEPRFKINDLVAYRGDPQKCGRVEWVDEKNRSYSVRFQGGKLHGYYGEEELQDCDGDAE